MENSNLSLSSTLIQTSARNRTFSTLITVSLLCVAGCTQDDDASSDMTLQEPALGGATIQAGGAGAASEDDQAGAEGAGAEGAGAEGAGAEGAGAEGAGAEGAGAEGAGAEGAGAESSEACETTCAALIACVSDAEGLCQGVTSDQSALIGEACLNRCNSFSGFSAIADGIDQCSDWIEFAAQELGESVSRVCETNSDAPPPEVEECQAFSTRTAECIVERCPAFESISAGGAKIIDYICREQVAKDEIPRSTFGVVMSDTPCDQYLVDAYASFFVEVNETPGSGSLESLCTEGPVYSPEGCADACGLLSPCIPPGSEGEGLRDLDSCMYFCVTSEEVSADVWSCIEDATTCGGAGACFP